jgi:hypothetical protein
MGSNNKVANSNSFYAFFTHVNKMNASREE